jgi:hypothetical protein
MVYRHLPDYREHTDPLDVAGLILFGSGVIGFLHSGSPLEKRLIIPDSIRVRAEKLSRTDFFRQRF